MDDKTVSPYYHITVSPLDGMIAMIDSSNSKGHSVIRFIQSYGNTVGLS
jgi:hypothetical protein